MKAIMPSIFRFLPFLILLAGLPSFAQCPTLNLSAASGSACHGSPIVISNNTFSGGATQVTLSHNGSGSLSSGTIGVSPFSFSYIPSAADNGSIITITLTTNNPAGAPCAPAVKTFAVTVTGPPVLNVVSPPAVCQPQTVNITLPSVTPGAVGTLSYWTNATATTPLANPSAIATSGTYYIKAETSPGCTVISPVSVIVGLTPTSTPVLFCDTASPNTTPNSIAFDFNNMTPPQLYFSYSYTIDGGPPITGTHVAPSNFTVTGLNPGQTVSFTLNWVGICTPPKTVTCTTDCITTTTTQFAPITPICQGSTPPTLPTTSTNGVTGTWNPAAINTSAAGTTNYIFTPHSACATVFTQPVVVQPLITPTFAAIGPLCQNASAPALPNTSTNGIMGSWNAAISTAAVGTVNYIFTPNPGQCAVSSFTLPVTVNANTVPVFTQQAPICQGTNITLPTTSNNGIAGTWTPAFNSNATTIYTFAPSVNCASPVNMTVTVNPSLNPNFAAVPAICQNEIPSYSLPTTSPNGITGAWLPATVNTTVAATTTHVFTPTVACANPQALIITVNPRKTIDLPFAVSVCQNSTPPTLANSSPQGISGSWLPAMIDTSAPGTFNYVFTANPGQCINASTHTMAVTVDPRVIPDFPAPGPFCAGETIPALPNVSPNGVSGTWNPPAINNMATTNYTFTPLSTECASPQTISIAITPRPVPQFAAIPAFCQGSVAPVLPATSIDGFTGVWSPATVSNTASGNYTFVPDAGQCAANAVIPITVDAPVDPNFSNISFCSGTIPPSLQGVSPNGIVGTWTPSVIDNTVSGNYVFTPAAGECANPQTIQVTVNQDTLHTVDYSVTPAFANNSVITVLATDPGNYLYQLDYGIVQQSNVFEHVPQGLHTVTVTDANGCSAPISVSGIRIINYPAFFTPNADNHNDTWTINGLTDDARIFIFDRYGKLIKQITPNGAGWDGTYNGQPLPSSDYWFSVDYREASVSKTFKSHFSLKR